MKPPLQVIPVSLSADVLCELCEKHPVKYALDIPNTLEFDGLVFSCEWCLLEHTAEVVTPEIITIANKEENAYGKDRIQHEERID